MALRNGIQNIRTYFRSVPVVVILLIATSVGYYSWVIFAPETIPYDTLGPLGALTKYLLENYSTALKICYWNIW